MTFLKEKTTFLKEKTTSLKEKTTSLKEKFKKTKSPKTLQTMPEDVKTLYIKVLAAQSLADCEADPREVSELYRFMAFLDIGPSARMEVREFMFLRDRDLPTMAMELTSCVEDEEEKEAVKFSIIKDMIRISKVDGTYSDEEQKSVTEIANRLYDEEKARKVIELVEEIIERDDAILKGEVKMKELKEAGKQVAAQSAAIGVPIAALYFTGSVVGLSAAGITSGLATLGLGGVLGLSGMVTGIGVVVVLGVLTYVAFWWALSGKEVIQKKRREHMIQEIIKIHQKAIANLSEDIHVMAGMIDEVRVKAATHDTKLSGLESNVKTLESALADLKVMEKELALSA